MEEYELRHKINGLLVSARRAFRNTYDEQRAEVYQWFITNLETILMETYKEKDWLARAREDVTKGDYVGAYACMEKYVEELKEKNK